MDEKDIKLHWHLYAFQVNGTQFVTIPIGNQTRNITDNDITEAREAVVDQMIDVETVIVTSISYLGNMSYYEFYA